MSVVSDNEWVILHAGTKRIFQHIRPGHTFKVGRERVLCDALIGEKYGTAFEVHKGKTELIKISAEQLLQRSMDRKAWEEGVDSVDKDNSQLFDDNEAQALQMEDIETLKKEVDADALISHIASNSVTFAKKTEYSQEKYLKRKRDKYVTQVSVSRPSGYSLSEAYFVKYPQKTLHLRPDSLAQLLSKSNVRAYSQTIVVDTCMSLVVAAVMERQGGFGRVLRGYDGNSPNPEAIRSMNFSAEVEASLMNFPLCVVDQVLGYVASGSVPEDASEEKRMLCNLSDSLVIATYYDPEAMFDKLFPLLAPGGAFVLFSPVLEGLARLYCRLKNAGGDKTAVLVQLSETWYREYQVLPQRTHPMNGMSAASGYLLSGIKVVVNQ